MSTIPERMADVIPWCRTHIKAWEVDPENIGLDEQTVAALDALTDEALEARRAYERLQLAADAALAHSDNLTGTLRRKASNAVVRVHAYAPTQPDPGRVLVLALLPKRRDASPLPAPGKPSCFKYRLLDDGSLEVAFECDNKVEGGRRLRGVTYEVHRRETFGARYEFVCTAPERRFRDETIPMGRASVTYRVIARTTTRRGKPAEKTVNFGSGCVLGKDGGERAA